MLKPNVMHSPVKMAEYVNWLKQISFVYVLIKGLAVKDVIKGWTHVMTSLNHAAEMVYAIKMKNQKKQDLVIVVNVIYGGVVSCNIWLQTTKTMNIWKN